MKAVLIIAALLSLSACDRAEMSAKQQAEAYKACKDVGLEADFIYGTAFDHKKYVAMINCVPPGEKSGH